MILFITGIIILLLTFLRFMVAMINLISRPYLPLKPDDSHYPLLSVLIPARNEEANIGRLLGSLKALSYENAEIIVYDDGSADNTSFIIKECSLTDSRIRYISGGGLPSGWTGKNYACRSLAAEAKGDFLLFLDADVTAGNDLLRRSVSYAVRNDLTLLSIFPGQEMQTAGEKIVVPFMFRMLLSMLPLVLVRRCPWSSFSAANGQMMLFRKADYSRCGFHEAVREYMAEDIEIMRAVKRAGLKGDTLVGGDEITCRMYTGYHDAINGFSRNIFSMFGNSMLFFMLFSLAGLLGWLLLLLLPWYFIVSYLFMIISLNIMIAKTSHQPVGESLRWLLPGIAAFYHIAFLALKRRETGTYEWKGRKLTGK
jgi:glycosyltransferase involved in cell wall biosynthesis